MDQIRREFERVALPNFDGSLYLKVPTGQQGYIGKEGCPGGWQMNENQEKDDA
jgi:hypothetical protein